MSKRILMAGALALAAATGMTAPAAKAQPALPTGMMGVKIAVTDFARSTAFYSALGLRGGTKYNDHETSLEWVAPARGTPIIMVLDKGGPMPAGMQVVRGGGFVAIVVADIAATLDRLKAAGFSGFGQPQVRPGFAMLIVRDPDGNKIELISAAPGTPPGAHAGH